MTATKPPAAQAGSYRVGDLDLNRIGYGAMQLAGPGVFGPPRDRAPRSRCCGPRSSWASTTSTRPTPTARTSPTRSSGKRSSRTRTTSHRDQGRGRPRRAGWLAARPTHRSRCATQVHDNLAGLGLDVLDVVNLRTLTGIDDRAVGPDSLTPQFEALAELQQQGLIRHLGLSTVSADQLAEAQQIAPVVCVQNFYNIANRADAALLAAPPSSASRSCRTSRSAASHRCSRDGLDSVAKRLGATPTAVALSWLLQHSPNIMLIPGTSSVDHLRQNIAGAALALPSDAVAELDAI